MFMEEEILKKKEEFLKIKTADELTRRKEEFRECFFEIHRYPEVEKHLEELYGDYAFVKFVGPVDEVYKSKDDKWGSKLK